MAGGPQPAKRKLYAVAITMATLERSRHSSHGKLKMYLRLTTYICISSITYTRTKGGYSNTYMILPCSHCLAIGPVQPCVSLVYQWQTELFAYFQHAREVAVWWECFQQMSGRGHNVKGLYMVAPVVHRMANNG